MKKGSNTMDTLDKAVIIVAAAAVTVGSIVTAIVGNRAPKPLPPLQSRLVALPMPQPTVRYANPVYQQPVYQQPVPQQQVYQQQPVVQQVVQQQPAANTYVGSNDYIYANNSYDSLDGYTPNAVYSSEFSGAIMNDLYNQSGMNGYTPYAYGYGYGYSAPTPVATQQYPSYDTAYQQQQAQVYGYQNQMYAQPQQQQYGYGYNAQGGYSDPGYGGYGGYGSPPDWMSGGMMAPPNSFPYDNAGPDWPNPGDSVGFASDSYGIDPAMQQRNMQSMGMGMQQQPQMNSQIPPQVPLVQPNTTFNHDPNLFANINPFEAFSRGENIDPNHNFAQPENQNVAAQAPQQQEAPVPQAQDSSAPNPNPITGQNPNPDALTEQQSVMRNILNL
jgi:hypothetical protein